ncbi:hypothetical protein RE428_25670 [Marinobacter nanhaiticus D15-8W]|nr:hypothetical protein RE428_25670 [Marinobacter nanhaiticus D15-8W]
MAQTVPFDDIDTACGGVEQQVHQGIGQQVDLIDVEHAAIGFGQKARLEGNILLRKDLLQVEAADKTIFARTKRHVDKRWVLSIVAWGQYVGQTAGERGLRAPTGAGYQDATNPGINGVQEQGGLERVLADDGRKRKLRQ